MSRCPGAVPDCYAAPDEPAPGDGRLQICGGDEATITYTNRYTADGKVDQKVLAKVKMVSTASVGFTDGAYREYTKGVFGDEAAFLRVKDMNRSLSKQPARVTVKVSARFKPQKEKDDKTAADADSQEERFETRDSVNVTLAETETLIDQVAMSRSGTCSTTR